MVTGVVSSTVHTVDESSALFRDFHLEDFNFFHEILNLLYINEKGESRYIEAFLRMVCSDRVSDASHPERADLIDIGELKDSLRQRQDDIDRLTVSDSGQMPRPKSELVSLKRRWDSLFHTNVDAYKQIVRLCGRILASLVLLQTTPVKATKSVCC
jgi:hypothetical protein